MTIPCEPARLERSAAKMFLLSSLMVLLSAANLAAQNRPSDLASLSLEELLKITVTSASRKEQVIGEIPAAVYVITRDDIRRSGLKTVPEVLRLAPGVNVAQINSNKWAVSIRGFNALYANKLLVLVDGRSVYNRIFAGVNWDAEDLVMEDIERIEVIRGPGAAMWGANAVNGVINIVTRSSADTEGTLVKVAGGTGDAAGVTLRYGAPIGSGSYRIYSQLNNRGHLEPLIQTGESISDAWHQLTAGARTDWKTGANSFMVQGNAQSNRSRANWIDLSPGSTLQSPTDAVSTLAGGYVLGRWTHETAPGRSFELQSHVDLMQRQESVGHYERRAVDFDAQQRLRVGRYQDINFGGGYRSTTESFDGANGYTLSPRQATEGLLSAFVQDEVSLASGRLRVSGGARVEHASYSGTAFQPTARAIGQVARRQYVWGAVSRALRTPSLSDRYISVEYPTQPGPGGLPLAIRLSGDPDMRPERLISNEAGYRIDLAPALSVDVTAFHGRYADLRGTQPLTPIVEFRGRMPVVVAPARFQNLLDARTRGMEIAGHWSPFADWRVDANYSFFRLTPYPHAGSMDPERLTTDSQVPSHQWTLHAGGRIRRRVLVDATLFRVGRIATMDVPGYARLDVGMEVQLPRQFSIAVAGRNLTNRSHLEFTGGDSNLIGSRIPRSADISLVWRR